ncbi:MAG: hypothetical protein MUC99_04400 [Anaerolineae bacterium]|nr:hypothetical protein [Anaerolineae bacterium]
MRWRTGYVLALVMIMVVRIGARSQDDAPLPPYLYYHSPAIGGFVIERADGSDHHTLALGFTDATQNILRDVLWSPSGRWVVWQTAVYRELSTSFYRAWGTRVDGSARLTVLESPHDIWVDTPLLTWAPDRDVLLVVQITRPSDGLGEPATAHYRLIEPDTNTILANHDIPLGTSFVMADPRNFEMVWLPDARGVVVSTVWDLAGAPASIVTLGTTGIVSTITTTQRQFAGLLPDGAYGLLEGRGLTIYRNDGSTERYPLDTETEVSHRFSTSPDGLTVLAFDAFGRFWRLDHATLQAVPIITKAGQEQLPPVPLWSSDGARALYVDTDGVYQVYERVSDTVQELFDVPDHLHWAWADDDRQVLFYQADRVTVYDIVSHQSTTLERWINFALSNDDLFNPVGYPFYPSPDGRYVGTTDRRIYFDGSSFREFTIHSAAVNISLAVELYVWHPTESWAIVGANLTEAGCCGATAFGAVNAQSTSVMQQRELTIGRGDIAGWLPDSVIPHLVPPAPSP